MIQALLEYFSGPLGRLELAATVFLVVNVYLLGQQRLSNFAFGFVGVVLFGFLFHANRLYSDMLLQWLFYAPLQIIGFYLWKFGSTLGDGDVSEMRVVWLDFQYWLLIAIAVCIAAAGLGYAMSHTDASFPYADALTTTLSVMASLLMLKKIIENWVLWIVMDLIAIPIYVLKGLYVTAGLYVIFLGLSVIGLLRWSEDYAAREAK
ncbi:MAG: nicotinamide riboside transporter PnuC [Pseudomonadota bacterium]